MIHRFAILTAVSVFLLLLVGGTVNPTGSSLACPEPSVLCHGELFPEMKGGVLYEHGHRLVAMTVGFLQIILTVMLVRRRRDLRLHGLIALLMVCAQGGLGALTVKYKLPTWISVSHLGLAMAYFAMVIYLAWRTRPSERSTVAISGRVRRLIAIAGGAVFAQIMLGALMRHTGGALACVDLPLCGGSLWPAGAAAPLQLHMLHRIVGVVAGCIAIAAGVAAYRAAGRSALVRGLAVAIPVVVLAQITLGVLSVYTFRAVPIVVAHLGGGAALWAGFVVLFLITRPAGYARGNVDRAAVGLGAESKIGVAP